MDAVLIVRAALREERKRRFSSGRKAADAAGLDPSTVAKVENQKSFPDYDPGIGTIAKLLTGMGMTLSSFFSQIETREGGHEPRIGNASVLTDGIPAAFSASDTQTATAILAVGGLLAESLKQSVDRLAAARNKAPTPGRHTSARRQTNRKVRG